jgi:hypothetical protein
MSSKRDVVPEAERDLNDWYNVEHMPARGSAGHDPDAAI